MGNPFAKTPEVHLIWKIRKWLEIKPKDAIEHLWRSDWKIKLLSNK